MANRPAPALPRKRTRSLADEVMADLTEKIRGGMYRPGEKLPTESEVMAGQGVSRTVVREALSGLQAAGLVETRHGVGTFVLPPAAPALQAFDLTTVASIKDVLEILEIRISLETEAAGLAALRRNGAHLLKLRAALDDFERELQQGRQAIDADFQFHLQIALATGNAYFEEFYRQLGTTTIPRTRLDTAQLSALRGANYLHRTNLEHEAILEAITRQDPRAARDGMHKHLSDSQERLRLAFEAQGRF